jgi:hypothetical protein
LKFFELGKVGFWRSLQFSNEGAKIKEKEKIGDVLKQRN